MGMGFENCEVGFGKKMNWEMGLVHPLQNTQFAACRERHFYFHPVPLS